MNIRQAVASMIPVTPSSAMYTLVYIDSVVIVSSGVPSGGIPSVQTVWLI